MEITKMGCENLCIGIVKQAAEDYLRAKKNLHKAKRGIYRDEIINKELFKRDCKLMIDECLRFFKSEWYKVLCKVDSTYLVERLDDEFEIWKKEFDEKHKKKSKRKEA